MNQVDQHLTPDPLLQLLDLSRRARAAGSAEELAFVAVNDSGALAPYRQGALWFAEGGIEALSGVVTPHANAPYAQWLGETCRHLTEIHAEAVTVEAVQLPGPLAAEWADWLTPYGLWLPLVEHADQGAAGGLLLAAETPWPELAIPMLEEWLDIWHHAWLARRKPTPWSWPRLKQRTLEWLAPEGKRPWQQQRHAKLAGAVLAVLLFPVRLSVLAPGELVPANPAGIRAPVDGVVGQFQVQPNQAVRAGQSLFSFEEASIAARQEVAAQTLSTAEAEHRQYAQQALSDAKSKAQLAILLRKNEEKHAEAVFHTEQFERSKITVPQDGIALFDDPSEWIVSAR